MTEFLRKGCSKLNERFFRISGKQYTVYVEGDIDKLFWQDIFPTTEGWTPKMEILKNSDGTVLCGWANMLNYLDKMIQAGKKINFLMAIDGDYHEIIHHKPEYDNVVMTKRYNLENYIYCAHSLNKVMNTLSFGLFDNVEFIKVILSNFAEMIKQLIIIDCVNTREDIRISVYDMSNEPSQTIKSISNHVKTMSKQYKSELESNKNILDGHNIVDYIRWKEFNPGNLIRIELNKKIKQENNNRRNNRMRKIRNISREELNTYCIHNCAQCRENCPDYNELKEKAKAAFDNLKLVI